MLSILVTLTAEPVPPADEKPSDVSAIVPIYTPTMFLVRSGCEVLLHDDMPAMKKIAMKHKKIVFFIV